MLSSRFAYLNVAVLASLLSVTDARAEPEASRWRLDSGLSIRHFQQQVKAEVGDPRGQRLVMESELGLMAMGTWNVWGPVSIGAFGRMDIGSRSAARFAGFDSEGRTVTEGRVGGQFTEYWLGPAVRVGWKSVFAELGYAALGIRNDQAREDLLSESGESGLFGTLPSIRWLLAFGGYVPVIEGMDLALRLEYRFRYYDSRSGEPLAGNIAHGTQSVAMFAGVSFPFGL